MTDVSRAFLRVHTRHDDAIQANQGNTANQCLVLAEMRGVRVEISHYQSVGK